MLCTRQPGQAEREVVGGAHVTRLPIEHRWGGSALDVAREYLGFTVRASFALPEWQRAGASTSCTSTTRRTS